MTVQETIIEAFKASHTAHNRALATIASLRSDKGSLEAEVARLNSQVANLKSHIAHLEAEAVKIVEPASVHTLLASLLQIVEETQQATQSASAAPAAVVRDGRRPAGPPQAERERQDITPPAAATDRPILSFQQRQSPDREAAPQEAFDAAH